MSDTLLDIAKEFGCLSIAIMIGVYRYHYLRRFFWILLIQAFLAMTFLISAHVVLIYQESNHWLYNIYLPIEILLLMVAARTFFNRPVAWRAITYASGAFVLTYITEIVADGFFRLANMSLAIGGMILAALYLFILYSSIRASKNVSNIAPEFWACLGIAMYFAGNVPFIGIIHQLHKYDPILVENLFYIPEALAIVRYAFLCISFHQLGRVQEMTAT